MEKLCKEYIALLSSDKLPSDRLWELEKRIGEDKRMGCTERGAYVTLVSMADDWNISVRGLAAIMPDGVTKISGVLKRLETLGYLRRERLYENGKIKDWVYYIYWADEPARTPHEQFKTA